MAQEFNNRLVKSLHDIWKRDKTTRKGEFLDLSDASKTNEIERDAWKLIPRETKAKIKELFGDEGFPVRKDMVDNAVGYRGFSIGEAWAGPSTIKPEHKKLIRDITAITPGLGPDAFKRLVTAQKALQAGVGVAKNIIVILSIVVPVANIASNVQQVLTNGVSPRDMWRDSKLALVETERLQKYEKRLNELPAFKARHRNNDVELRKLAAEEKSINDAIDRLSIGPLYRAGEFTTIAEGETEVDAAIANGTWVEKLKEKVDKLPEKAGDIGRYAMITKDTALFKGMARSVQYGDFIAKVVVYNHLTKRKGKSHEEAMKTVIDEFVAYNFLPSRMRSGLESFGLSWFWAYKLRSIKVAQRLLRDHPLRALMAGAGGPLVPDVPGVNVGSPITDNAAVVLAEGRAGFSIGPDMLFRAPSMHPVIGLMY